MKRILIVEDEQSIALALAGDLRGEGYEVETCGDGESAAERGAAGSWNLILLDVMLPGKDGFEVCRDLRNRGTDTPILMLTAKTHEAEKVMGLELGADDYVTKPYSPRELRARVKALLRRAAGKTGDVYRFGDNELDFVRCELRRRGKAVELSALDFKLLEAFVRNAGRVLTRQRLLDLAWGRGVFVTERVVDNSPPSSIRKPTT